MTRKRCNHRYKGLYGNYKPRMRRSRDKRYVIWEYQCQIKGCNHWGKKSVQLWSRKGDEK